MRWALLLAGFGSIGTAAPFPFDGFGRFGRVHGDGLLTFNVSPTGFETIGGSKRLALTWGDQGITEVKSIDGVEKWLTSPSGGQLRWPLSFPGFARFLTDDVLFRVEPNRTTASAGMVMRSVVGRTSVGFLIGTAEGDVPPVLVSIPSVEEARLEFDAATGTYRTTARGWVRIVSPTGVVPTRLDDALPAAREWVDRSIPVLQSIRREGARETSTWSTSYAPVPPVTSLVPVDPAVGELRTGPETRYGVYRFVDGRTSTLQLRFGLPDHRGYVAPAAMPDLGPQMDRMLEGFQAPWAVNAVDLGYARRAPALMAGPLLPSARREEILALLARDLPRAFDLQSKAWTLETEPFSGERYVYTYALPGPGGFRYDIEWGNLLPVYGLFVYAQHTGDWAMVQRLWPGVKAAIEFVEQSQDWAWMTGVNADHGFSTGTGDALNASYVGMATAVRMALAVGDTRSAERWGWLVRRMAIPTAARLRLSEYAEPRGLMAANRIALGFHETEHVTRTPLDGDPWYPVTLLSGNGAFPELMHLCLSEDREGLRQTMEKLERAYPDWANGSKAYGFRTTYNGNSLYVTAPVVYARALLGERGLESRWAGMAVNNTHGWVGANVLAELHAAPTVLRAWMGAGYLGGRMEGNEAVLRFRAQSAGTLSLSWTGPLRLAQVGSAEFVGTSLSTRVEAGEFEVRLR